MTDKKSLTEHIEEIIETERKCAHHSFSGVGLSDRYMEILNTILLLLEDREKGLLRLEDMLKLEQVSPEALALVLEYHNLKESPARWMIEELLEKLDYEKELIFYGCLMKKTRELQTSLLEQREHIRRTVRANQIRNDEDKLSCFSGKGVVYTVIIGGYDRIWEPLVVNPEWDYICITDNRELQSVNWTVIPLADMQGLDDIRRNRRVKLLPWEYLADYDYSIYLDGNIQIIGDLTEWIAWYAGKRSMLCFPHSTSSSLRDELNLIGIHRKEYYQDAKRQVEEYYSEGYPDVFPMISGGCILRNHHDRRLMSTMECWWKEILTKTPRDQISFVYSCWKNGFTYDLCELDFYENYYIRVRNHNSK